MKKALLGLLLLLVVLLAVMLINTFRMQPEEVSEVSVTAVEIDAMAAAERMAGGIKYRTISHQQGLVSDSTAFDSLASYIERTFPQVHEKMTLSIHGGFSRLYKWSGADANLKPILFMGHMDVVPVDPTTIDEWRFDAFAGTVADDIIWGRGAIDNKLNVFGLLEACEKLINDGFAPERTVYLAFGHDEEVGGTMGAAAIAKHLEDTGVELEFVLDEGGAVMEDAPGISEPLAIIGVAEKGFVTLELTSNDEGGHSSTPPPETAITSLAKAIARVSDHPFEARFTEPVEGFFEVVAPHMSFSSRFAFANRWLLNPILLSGLGSDRSMNAMVRTTTAPTLIKAGVKDNVLPIRATASINHRILPGETAEEVIARVRELVDDDRIQVEFAGGAYQNPSPTSRTDTPAYGLLSKTINGFFPGAVTAPYLLVGGTDAKYFYSLSESVYRFTPMKVGTETLKLAHGTDEHVSVALFGKAIQFYHHIIESAAGGPEMMEPNAL